MRRRFGTKRRTVIGVAALAALAMGPVTAVLQANASPSFTPRTKTPIGSVNVSATATGIRSPLYSHQGEDAELELPYSAAQLGAGGTGHALTSIFWPGSTGGALGSTLGVLGVSGLPTSLSNALNDPVKAEAPTTDGSNTVTKNLGAVTMKAVAKETTVNATTSVGPTTPATVGQIFGSIKASTTIQQNADNVVVNARSAIANLSIAGVISIGSIVSTAHAVSNGKHSHGTTETEIGGIKIAGVNVTVDQNGVEVTGKDLLPAAVLKTLNTTVNKALNALGIRIFVARGTKKIKGPSVNLDAGDLIIEINKPGYKSNFNDTGILLELGGASIDASASPGYVAPVISNSIPPSTQPGASNPPSTGTTPAGNVTVPSAGGATLPPAPAETTAPQVASTPQVAPSALSLPSTLGVGWIVLGLILAGLFAFGLKRLPDRVLAASGPACSLEEES